MCTCILSCSVVSSSLQPHGLQPARLLCSWNFLGKNTRLGCHFLLQGVQFICFLKKKSLIKKGMNVIWLYCCILMTLSTTEFTNKGLFQGLPQWLNGQESACQCRRHGSLSMKIPHALEQLSPYATTIEPVLQSQRATTTDPHITTMKPKHLQLLLCSERSHCNEKPEH